MTTARCVPGSSSSARSGSSGSSARSGSSGSGGSGSSGGAAGAARPEEDDAVHGGEVLVMRLRAQGGGGAGGDAHHPRVCLEKRMLRYSPTVEDPSAYEDENDHFGSKPAGLGGSLGPDAAGAAASVCHWCCHPPSGKGAPMLPMPVRKTAAQEFVCHHVFCSFECMTAFNDEDTRRRGAASIAETANLINDMARALGNYRAPVAPAPHWSVLRLFGGEWTVEDFRRVGADRTHLCVVNPVPIVAKQDSVTEVPLHDLVEKKYSFVPIDDDRINRFKSTLRLQRSKPVLRNGSLHDTMNLTLLGGAPPNPPTGGNPPKA